jgi:hypothetical protein
VLKAVGFVVQILRDADALAESHEYASAMNSIGAARDALVEAHPGLGAVTALAQARARLSQVVERIDASLRAELREMLMSWNM